MENKADDLDLMEFIVRWGRQTSKGVAIASVLSASVVRCYSVHVSLGGCFFLVHLMTEHKYPPLASTSLSKPSPFYCSSLSPFLLIPYCLVALSSGFEHHKHRDSSLFSVCPQCPALCLALSIDSGFLFGSKPQF